MGLRHLTIAALLLVQLHADEARIESIVAGPSPEERVAQLSGMRLNGLMVDGRLSLQRAAELVRHGIGHVEEGGGTKEPCTMPACGRCQTAPDGVNRHSPFG